MPVRLKVPLVHQPPKTPWCGPACAAMVTRYYGVRASIDTIARELPILPTGIDMAMLGAYFVRKGFRVTLKLWYAQFQPRFRWLDSSRNEEAIRNALRTARRSGDDMYAWHAARLAKFVQCGGRLVMDSVQQRDIIKELRSGRPVILNYDHRTLRGYSRIQKGHYVVIVGSAGKKFLANDPADRSHAQPVGISAEQLLFACHIWKGGALFVRPA